MLEDKPVSIAIREIAEGKLPDLTAPAEEPTAMEAAFQEAEAEAETAEEAEEPQEPEASEEF